jgi:hypothetical protein
MKSEKKAGRSGVEDDGVVVTMVLRGCTKHVGRVYTARGCPCQIPNLSCRQQQASRAAFGEFRLVFATPWSDNVPYLPSIVKLDS